MLSVSRLRAGYGPLEVLHAVDFVVNAGEVVALIGANAAGKTTTLNTLAGVLPAWAGRVEFEGEDITTLACHQRVEKGLILVPQGRQLFPHMSVEDNLALGAFTQRASRSARASFDQVYDLFPVLSERKKQHAGTLSGGEQSMLALARGLMARPKLLMLDEPTEGLSPLLVSQTMDMSARVAESGVTVLLVEQNVTHALKRANRGYVIESGRVTLHGPGADLLADDALRAAFLGL